MNILGEFAKARQYFSDLRKQMNRMQNALGRIEANQQAGNDSNILSDYEFQVYSQWGEDGILQYLTRKIPVTDRVFVEFGVEKYTESNTRFLLQNNYWAGLIIDGSEENIQFIKSDPIYWRYNLKAACAFISCENINELLLSNGVKGDIGLLSVDIDGNDYWVWQAISAISPRIVVCEYNSLFGPERQITIPYDKEFWRSKGHYSNLIYGASIGALTALGHEKGYCLVGANQAGNNCFFVRKDLCGDIPQVLPRDVYRKSCFREGRDSRGQLTLSDFKQRVADVASCEVLDLESGQPCSISSLWSPND